MALKRDLGRPSFFDSANPNKSLGQVRYINRLSDKDFVRTMPADLIHTTIKAIFNSLVPREYRVLCRLVPYDLSSEDPTDLRNALECLLEELSQRPERTCLVDLELNHMMQTYRRLGSIQICTTKHALDDRDINERQLPQ
jgi:hypothetical protein